MDLYSLGWNRFFQAQFDELSVQGCVPGRVVLEHKHMYRVVTEYGEVLAEVTGKLRHLAAGRADFPAVGDWILVKVRETEARASIHAILPRKSKFSRKVAGTEFEEQIVAANVDTVFLVNALNQDFNLRRMERYLTVAWESGANPVFVLSKSDLCNDVQQKVADVETIAFGVPVHVTSTLTQDGLAELQPYLQVGHTIALLGSSGAGKSSLLNHLYGENIQQVGDIRAGDDKGKHTTTHRELVQLPNGGILIDTPGMRELQLWDAGDGLGSSFQDIESLAAGCRFRDCSHREEPGCAIREALQDGSLEHDRFQSFLKLQRELAYLARKDDKQLLAAEKQKWKKIHQAQKKNRP